MIISMEEKGSLAMPAVHREYCYECCRYIQTGVAVQVSNGINTMLMDEFVELKYTM